MAAHAIVRDATDQLEQALLQLRAPLGRRPLSAVPFPLEQHVGERTGAAQDRLHRIRPLLADEVIRVKPVGQECKGDAQARFQVGKNGVDGPETSLLASRVTIETQDRFGAHPPQQLDLIFSQRRTERGDGLAEACFRQRHDIHVAFDGDYLFAFMGQNPGLRGVEQDAAFVKQRRFGRVEVLRRNVLLERAATECDYPVLQIGDRKDHAIAEPVVGNGDIVAADEHARCDHLGYGEAKPQQMILEGGTSGRSKTEAKFRYRLPFQAAPLEV